MTTKISGDNLQANIAIDTTGDQVFNGTLKLNGNFPTGTDNVALGNTALDNGSLTGSQNVAIGSSTLTDTDTGADNTAVGFEALKVVTTGTNNTAIGSGAGSTITSGSNLTLVGYNATPSAIDATNEITLGDANVTDVRIPGPGIYVDSTGLGIGTASPSTKLDVSGTANVSGNVTFGADLTVDTDTLYVDSTNNRVGIGTTSPSFDLQIEKDGGGSSVRLNVVNTGVATNDDTLLSFVSGSNDNENIIYFGDVDDSNVGRIRYDHASDFMGFTTNASEAMRIDSSGNVGIGESSPTARLHIANDQGGAVGRVLIDANVTSGYETSINVTNTGFELTSKSNSRPIIFNTGSTPSEAMRINGSGQVGIGTTSPGAILHIGNDSAGNENTILRIEGGSTSGYSQVHFADSGDVNIGRIQYTHSSNIMALYTNDAEAMRIDASQQLLVGKTTASGSVEGAVLGPGYLTVTRSSATPVFLNRLTSDGDLIKFEQDNILEGSISVSGATVSYNGFTGTHWSRLSDNSKPTILKGTILESLDEMMDWYQVQFDITETDDEGNEITRTEKQSYALGDGESVGDVITYNHEGTDYSATIVQEADIKHTKCKVSDTANSKRVYGVFVSWDNDDDTVNDMYVAQVGTYVIRVHSSATVEAGDMLVSNGDGTAVTLSEDTPWTVGVAKTIIGKVLSTTKIETYEDGSYTVPCSLSC